MRLIYLLILAAVVLAGCGQIDGQLTLDVAEENDSTTSGFSITAHTVDFDVISRANSSPFVRYAHLGGERSTPARRVVERELFSGPKPPYNLRPEYRIGVGDRLTISRHGYSENTDGIQNRSSVSTSHTVGSNGAIKLPDGSTIFVAELTRSEAEEAVNSVLFGNDLDLPIETNWDSLSNNRQPIYLLGAGDVLSISRLVEVRGSSGVLEQQVLTSQSVVDSSGVVSILQLGEIEVAGLSLTEARDRILQETTGSGSVLDAVVEIVGFESKKAVLITEARTSALSITDVPATFADVLTGIGLRFDNGRDYLVSLSRNGNEFKTKASVLLTDAPTEPTYILDKDKISIEEILPAQTIDLQIENYSARSVSFLRVSSNQPVESQQGINVPLDLRGMDLRQLLISQGVGVNQNQDLLVHLHRENKRFILSAQNLILNNPNRRIWLSPGDHVIVEDVAYVGDNALLVGEIPLPQQLPVNRYQRTKLADSLFNSGAFGPGEADFRHIYVLRGEEKTFDAYHFDISNVFDIALSEEFELRPGDIVFVRTRPLSRYNRALALALTFVNGIDGAITNSRTFGR